MLTWPRELVALGADVTRAATARTLGGDRLCAIVGHTVAETAYRPRTAPTTGTAGRAARRAGRDDAPREPRRAFLRPGAADLRRQVATYIAEHVEDPDLYVEEIARAHFISVRGLHRVFADVQHTVGALIRRRD